MLTLNTGAYTYRIAHCPDSVSDSIEKIYDQEAINTVAAPVDFEIALKFNSILRRYFRPQITFYSDQQSPFKPMPLAQAYPVLEWGMNWCVAAFDYSHFIVHAAVLVKEGKAVIFPATPGSGKSTLTAYLSQNGWHLYSDEMAIIDMDSNRVSPLYRPVSLKNNSIDLIKQWFPEIICTDTAKGTQKGDVALFKCMDWNTYQDLEEVAIAGVVFPKFVADHDINIYNLDKIEGFSKLCTNAFNYNIVGERGFNTVAKVIDNSVQFEVHYSNLTEVNDFLLDDVIKI